MNSTLLLPPELNTPPEIKYKNINKTNSDTPASKKMVPEQYSNPGYNCIEHIFWLQSSVIIAIATQHEALRYVF